jgi:hypothetical protein
MLQDSGRHGSQGLGFGLQDRSTAALDLRARSVKERKNWPTASMN